MTLRTSAAALGLALLCCAGRALAAEPAQAVLEDFRLHGFASPLVALERLRAATPPPATAPAELRRRYQSTVANLAVRRHDQATTDAALAELARMANREACADCRTELQLRLLQQSLADDPAKIRSALAAVDPRPPADLALQFDWLYHRGAAYDALGEYDTAIDLGVKAADLAQRADLPADHALSFNLLVRSNSGRRDATRAIALAREGYARAMSIGFVHVAVLLRANEGYALSTLNRPHDPERRAVLQDVLRLARATRGQEDTELRTLINLAHYHNDQHEYEQAERTAAQAEALALKRHEDTSLAFANVDRGVALVHLGRVDEGLARARQGVAYAEQHGLKLESADLLAQLVDAAEHADRSREALQALRKLMGLRESLTNAQRDRAVLQLQEQYAAERKTREIERLQLESARHAAEAAASTSQRRLWAMTAVALALALLALAQWLARARQRQRRLEADNVKLNEQSSHDPLTGAFNRRHAEQWMALRAAADAPEGRVGLMVIDVDFFKKVNDTHGHASGDAVLVEVARRLQSLVRDRDAVVRWGGEEFVLLLPGALADVLPVIAQRVLDVIGSTPVALPGGGQLAVQVSGGAVSWPTAPGQRWQDALHLADLALYLAKADGRNRLNCLLSARADATLDPARLDLRAASEAGDVVLQSVLGPPVPHVALAVAAA